MVHVSHPTQQHTIVVSDIHLADAEPPHPRNPLWKRYKRPRFFMDRSFQRFLKVIDQQVPHPVELILNGDIFDFDSVMAFPENPSFSISWLERQRGLFPEEEKSRFKIQVILNDHAVWTEALRAFLLKGHCVVFIIGNHDLELHWRGVQQDILKILRLPPECRKRVRFCEWFYISENDTLIEHGNQYDSYSLCHHPIFPLIQKGKRTLVRIPFGNLANRYLLNGMGLINPHVDSMYISTLKGYFLYFVKYVMRTQPFLLWTWFWGAVVTLSESLYEGILPPLKNPLQINQHIEEIALKSKTSPALVQALQALSVHPAIFNPWKILKELWLDRLFLFSLMMFLCFEFFSVLRLFSNVSLYWFLIPFLLLLPFFIFYSISVETEIYKQEEKAIRKKVPLSAQVANMKRVVHGHTHEEMHTWIEGIEYLNSGTWSPAYRDLECTQSYGRKCFVWIQPRLEQKGRIAELYEWKDPGYELIFPKKEPS